MRRSARWRSSSTGGSAIAKFSGGPASEQLYQRVAERLVAYDARLAPSLDGGDLTVVEPATGWPVSLGVARDARGSIKLYAAAHVDRAVSRGLGSTLGRLLGTVQVFPFGNESEVRSWSPYRIEDIERTPAEADDWAAATLQTLLEEIRPRGASPPARPAIEAAKVAAPSEDADPGIPPESRTAERREAQASPEPTGGDAEAAAQTSDANVRSEETVVALAQAQEDLARTSAELDRVGALLEEATIDRERALAGLRDLEARSAGGTRDNDPVPALIASLDLISDAGARPGTLVAVLRQFLRVAPDDRRLRESLGVFLLRDDQVADAMATLSELGADGLTPRGAGALVEASFRQRMLPEPLDVLTRVDWRVGAVAQQLRDVPRWAKRDQLVPIAQLIAQDSPPDFEAFLAEVARAIAKDQLRALFDLWFDRDPSTALDQLVSWVAADRVYLSQTWVEDGIRLALTSEERRTSRAALELLSREAEHRKDASDLASLVDAARSILRPADWRPFALRELSAAAALSKDVELLDRCAAILIDVLRAQSAAREGDPEWELANTLQRGVSAALSESLTQELVRLRPSVVKVRDVTTVTEAVKATAERYPSLVVHPEAERSAGKRGTVGVKKAREALFALGEIAERFAEGEFDQGLDEALATLPDFKPDISDTAKRQFQRFYLRTLSNGRKVRLGPHFDIGGEDGRAYLYVDKEQRRIVLGHCGEHLPGKRDN